MTSELGQDENVGRTGVSITPVDWARFQKALSELLGAAGHDPIETACSALRFLLGVPGAHGAAFFCPSESGSLRPASSLICHNEIVDQIRGQEAHLVTAVDEMLQVGGPITYPLTDVPFDIFVLPVGTPARIAAAIALFATADDVESAACLQAAGMVAAELSQRWSNAAIAEPVAPITADAPALALPDAAAASFEHLLARLLFSAGEHDTAEAICRRMANALEQALPGSQVMIGFADRHGRRCRLQAISGMLNFSEHAPLVKQIEELMAESMLLDALFEVHSTDRAHERTAAEQSVLEATDARRLCHGPLQDESGTKVGAWIVVDHDANQSHDPDQFCEELQRAEPAVSGAVGLLRKTRPDFTSRLIRRWLTTGHDEHEKRRFWKAAVVVTALLMVPMPYRIACESELFPVTHRFVPAPYEGVLKEVLVKPGDVVTKGQVLARMDAKELEWQIAANRAEYMQASKEHDTNLANGNTSSAQVAQLEMDRLSAETKRLNNRALKLDVTSPISGIILGGESEKLEGARIRVGENLFETGPLERMVAEVYVPDEEIAAVRDGQTVQIRLDAFPLRTFRGTVARVSPRAETREDQNVFVADVELDNVKNLLRPGMEGRGRVSTGWYPWGWNLLHKPFYRLLSILRF